VRAEEIGDGGQPGEKATSVITPIAQLIRSKFQEAGLTEVEGGKASPEKLVLHLRASTFAQGWRPF